MIKTAVNKFIIIALGIITLVFLNFISMPASVRSASINAAEPAPDSGTPATSDTGETETPDITGEPTETPTAEITTDTPPEETETPAATDAVTTEILPTETPPTEAPPTPDVPATDVPTIDETTPEAPTPTPTLEFLQDFTVPPFNTDSSGNRTVPPDASPTRSGINASVGVVQVDIIENVEREFRWFDIILYMVDAMYILAVLAIVYGIVGIIGLIVFKKDISIAALKKHNKEKNKEKKKEEQKQKQKRGEKRK